MALPGQINPFVLTEFVGGTYQIEDSLRFRGGQRLNGNLVATAFTVSYWVKASSPGSSLQYQYCSGTDGVSINTSSVFNYLANGTSHTTPGVYRDPAAWYHVVVSQSGTGTNQGTLYINGSQVRQFTGAPYASSSGQFNIGRYYDGNYYFNGYIAEFHAVAGTALNPTSFGEYDENGVWIPKKYSGSYGSNGFYLDFSDPSNIGADRSGNGNNFTPSGFELSNTSSTSYDWMEDSPTKNHPLVNFLSPSTEGNQSQLGFDNAALQTAATSINYYIKPATFGITSGKWYWEGTVKVLGATNGTQGAANMGVVAPGFNANSYIGADANGWNYNFDALKAHNGVTTAYGSTYIQNAVIGVALDMDAKTITFYKDGVSQGQAFTGLPDLVFPAWSASSTGGYSPQWYTNYGNLPFAHTPPAGFKPLSTADLPSVDIKDPSDHFTTILDTGANILSSAQSTFSNGLWWIKDRANSNQHQFVDSVRGSTNALTSPNDVAESTYSAPSGNSVAWCWSAPEAWSNSAGSNGANIASSGRRNLDTGFSIVNYSGRRPTSSTLAHGLNQAPEFIICKTRNTTYSFHVHHKSIGSSYVLILDTSQSKLSSSGSFSSINSSTFTVGNDAGTNEVGTNNMIAWCWHSVPGYSRFGSYVGNANSDGPFVYCGFRPAFVMIKITSSSGGWSIFDTSRDTYNPALKTLKADEQTQEQSNSSIGYDLVSNGFKIRTSNSDYNSSGGEFIYMAFAEHPFGGSNVYPTPAR